MSGELAGNLLRFARLLRAAGLPIGTGRALDGVRALAAVDATRRDQFYWALHAVFVSRREHRELFDQAFQAFWQEPSEVDPFMALLLQQVVVPPKKAPYGRRVAEALAPPRRAEAPPGTREDKVVADAVLTWSDLETLRHKDFEQMSADELRRARRAIARMRLPVAEAPTRRFRPAAGGRRLDMRATLRASMRSAGEPALRWRERRTLPPPLVALCDVSGSMERYSRVLLHFLHALTTDRHRVSSFLFGTRLTNVTRYLRQRDPDVAIARVTGTVRDWGGGTRIGRCLAEFNLRWSRRVLGQGAVVLLISDGLDRDGAVGLEREVDRLHRSCRRLIWLNPLLRYAAFEPRAAGVRAILPHVDEFRPVHDLDSLEQLAAALGRAA